MTYDERQEKIVRGGIEKKGTQAELARYMGVPRQQVHDWIIGRCKLTGPQLVRLQDLVKRAACVLIVLHASAQISDARAVDKTPIKERTLYTLCMFIKRLARAALQKLHENFMDHARRHAL